MSPIHKPDKPRRIFVVDDHPVVRDGFRSIINEECDLIVCGEADDAVSALTNIATETPNLILLDLSLRTGSGLELLKDLAIRHPSIPVLVVSMHDEAIYADRVLKSGARGYLMKAESSEQLVAAMRRVLQGKMFVSESVMTAIASRLGGPKYKTDPIERLSDRELRVFELLGDGLSTAEIASQMHISVKTVQAYIARAKDKFAAPSLRELVREALRWHDSRKRLASSS